MTYSGLLMLVSAPPRHGFSSARTSALWPVLVMPALIVALALTFTPQRLGRRLRRRRPADPAARTCGCSRCCRSWWRSSSCSPRPSVTAPACYSMFDGNDPSNRDRVAMLQSGRRRSSATTRSPASGRTWSRRSTSSTASRARSTRQPASPQRADADRRRARPAGAGASGSGSSSTLLAGPAAPCRDEPPPVARRRRRSPRSAAMLAAGHVRIQLRGLRVPDALPGAGDAALRGRTRADAADAAATA